MDGNGGTLQKMLTPDSPRRSYPVAASPLKQGRHVAPAGRCCGRFSSCFVAAPTPSHQNPQYYYHQQQDHQISSKLKLQVASLEREVERQKELQTISSMRLKKAQDYLRHCLQIAQDNEFLVHIINKEDTNESSNIATVVASPHIPVPSRHHSDLATVISQAKLYGWYIEPHEIELGGMVAQGTTADIYRATWRGYDVAVKCIYPDFFHSNENGVSFFAQEVETLSRQRHRLVLHLMGACLEPPEHGWVVTEFLSTTLKEWLHGSGKRQRERTAPLPPIQDRVSKALEVAQAMQYLHEQKPMVVHRDLKPSNVFLDETMHVRVADFGHARFLCDGEKALTGETGTYVYMAPEVILCEPYTEKCDVYSFGILLNELITGDHPYIETDYSPTKIAMEVGEGNLRPALPEGDGQLEELIDLIRISWDGDASNRPSFAAIATTLKMIHQRFIDSHSL